MGLPPWRNLRVVDGDHSCGRGHREPLLCRRRRSLVEHAPVTDRRYVQALALGLDPAWRRLTDAERCSTAEELIAAVSAKSDVTTHSYSMVGLQAGTDLVLWSLGPSLESLEERAAGVL